MAGDDKDSIAVDLSQTVHPYEDENIITSQPDDVPILSQREPFNDVIKHGDIIVGHQRNRTLSDFSRPIRPLVRLYAVLSIIVIAGLLLWGVFH